MPNSTRGRLVLLALAATAVWALIWAGATIAPQWIDKPSWGTLGWMGAMLHPLLYTGKRGGAGRRTGEQQEQVEADAVELLQAKVAGEAELRVSSLTPDALVAAALPDGRVLRFEVSLGPLLDHVRELPAQDLWPEATEFEAGANLFAVQLTEALETAAPDAGTLRLTDSGIVAT
ncbi:hypothetical protein GCM10027591_06260 [Zhihengliuella somnathii]